MLERRSALATVPALSGPKVALGEVRGFTLTQAALYAGDSEATVASIAGPLPARNGAALQSQGRIVFRTGPLAFWFVGPEGDDIAKRLVDICAVSPLSHSRTRIFIEGPAARDVLAKGIALDLHPAAFGPGTFALTGLHHTPILLHCVAPARFEIYAMRTFAANIWEWLADAALEFAA